MLLGLVPILWFGGDWWGSGSPWHGADAACVAASEGHRFVDALGRVLDMVPWVAWLAAASRSSRHQGTQPGAARSRGRRRVWSVLVVATSAVFGYAASSRFLLPAAAVVCVLAGVGAVWAVTSLWRRSTLVTVVVVALVAVVLGARMSAFPALADEVEMRDRLVQGLGPAIERAGGADTVDDCGTVAIRILRRTACRAAAWKLALPLAEVERSLPDRGGVMFVTHGTEARRQARLERRFGADAVTVLARSSDWIVLAVGCGRPG